MRPSFRAAAPALLALALAGGLPQAAGARPWTASYDWNASSTTGYENWAIEETAPDSGQPLPFYRAYLGDAPGSIGRGLVFQPLGGRAYDNGNPSSQEGGPGVIARWNAPGQSRITRAVYGNTKYRNESDGQYMRSRVVGPGGQTIDYGPTYDEDDPTRTYLNPSPPFDRTSTAGTTAEFWLFTVCRPDQANPGSFACPDVPAGTGTFARLGTVNMTLDDPDQPAIAVESSPAIDDGWVNKRRTQRLTVTTADPSSGISRIRVQVRAGGATSGGRTLSDTNVTCDDQHRTADRGGLVCPPTATATATDPGSSQTAGDRTYVITAWDYAGNQAVTTQTVRRDIDVPSSGTVSGAAIREVTDGWTNRVGQIPVRLSGEDSRSGVSRLQLLARRVASGRLTQLADVAPSCERGCQRATETVTATLDRETLPRDGRYRLEVKVTDRAGNTKTFGTGRTLRVDRSAPLGTSGYVARRGDGRFWAFVKPGRDSGDSSGKGYFEVSYLGSHGNRATTRASASAGEQVRTKRGVFRVFVLDDFDERNETVDVVEADEAGNLSTPEQMQVIKLHEKPGRCKVTRTAFTHAGQVARAEMTGACSTGGRVAVMRVCIKRKRKRILDEFARDETLRCSSFRTVGAGRTVRVDTRASCAKYEGTEIFGSFEFTSSSPKSDQSSFTKSRSFKCYKPTGRAKCVSYNTPRTKKAPFVVYRGYRGAGVVYVGITRQKLEDRCRDHRRKGRSFARNIHQLKLRRSLTSAEAHGVEQTLINYYGRLDTSLSYNRDTRKTGPRGPLENIANSVSPDSRTSYCASIATGHRRVRDLGPGGRTGPYNVFRRPKAPLRTCG